MRRTSDPSMCPRRGMLQISRVRKYMNASQGAGSAKREVPTILFGNGAWILTYSHKTDCLLSGVGRNLFIYYYTLLQIQSKLNSPILHHQHEHTHTPLFMCNLHTSSTRHVLRRRPNSSVLPVFKGPMRARQGVDKTTRSRRLPGHHG